MQLLRSYVNDSMLTNLKGTNVQQSTPQQNNLSLYQAQSIHISPTLQVQSKTKECAINPVVLQQDDSVTNSESMEVFVDPGMFLADEESIIVEDDEETVSAAEAKIETAKLSQLRVETDLDALKQPVSKKVKFNDLQSDESHPCSSCPEIFENLGELQKHGESHLITTSTSSVSTSTTVEVAIEKPCKKKKAKEEKLKAKRRKIVIRINPSPSKRHVREKAKVLPKFVCAICRKNLSSKRNLHLHHETHKEPNGKFKCNGEGCKKLFGKLENFVKHRQEAHEKPVRRKKNINEK